MNKKIIWILVFLAFAVLATAECPPDCTAQDYSNPDSYSGANSADFLTNSDPSQWDWSQINEQNINNIWNNDNIQEALITNPTATQRYLELQGCGQCRINNPRSFIFTSGGVGLPMEGFASPRNYPAGTSFEEVGNEIIVKYPESSTISVPSTDTVTVDTEGKSLDLTGPNIPANTSVFGKITFRNSQAYVKTGEDLYINYVQISRSSLAGETPSSNEAMLFFSGQYVPGITEDYVSINPSTKNFFVYADDEPGGITMDFLPGNPFFNMYKDTDKVSLFAAYNAEMYYVAPSTEWGYPAVKVRETNEDRLVYSVTNGPFSFYKNYDSNIEGQANEIFAGLDPNLKLTTTPMLINPIDNSDNPIVSANVNGKQVNLTAISLDNFNRVSFVTDKGGLPFDYDFYLKQGLQPGQTLPPLQINSRHTDELQVGNSKVIITSKTYSEKELKNLIQDNPDYKIITGVPANKIGIVKQIIEDIPEGILNSFSGVNVLPETIYTYSSVKESKKLSYFNTGALSKEGGIISAPATAFWCEECSDEETFDRIKGIFTHEGGHQFVSRKRNEEGLAWYESGSTFDKEWEALYGNTPPPYGKLTKPENPLTVTLNWIKSIDLNRDDPYDSFLGAYANTNNDEHKAMAFEVFNSDPENVYKKLLDPSSKFYDARYLKQIELLCKEGGIKAANCQAYGVPYK